tara:strand:+ start:598 stop:1023 length:426 start_codon:yes stop_codon:yes gene_type:complete
MDDINRQRVKNKIKTLRPGFADICEAFGIDIEDFVYEQMKEDAKELRMTDFQIEKGIPIPERTYGKRRGNYPDPRKLLSEMEPGDSIFFPYTNGNPKKPYSAPGTNFRNTATRNGFKIEGRQQENNGVKGVRIWVTAKPDA